MKKVILDTNALLAVGQFKIDLFRELERICMFKYEVCVLDGSVDELDKIVKEQKGKDREAAKLALKLVSKVKVIKVKEGIVDDLLVEMDRKGDYILTQDRELKKRLKNLIFIRQKKYLDFG